VEDEIDVGLGGDGRLEDVDRLGDDLETDVVSAHDA
jgi:hypothetical protein